MAPATYKYRPSLYSAKELQALFVGREALLKRLLGAIDQAREQKGMQNFLLIGPRGVGKTHLLLLIHHTVQGRLHWAGIPDNLHQSWVPVLFPEESYGISSLAELLLAALKALKSESSEIGLHSEVDNLIAQCSRVLVPTSKERELLIDYFEKTNKQTGKRYLFLIDNLQLVLSRMNEADQGRLRDLLMQGQWLMLIGAAPTLFEEVMGYQKPSYNLFETIWLQEINLEEIESLLKEKLRLEKRTNLLENFESLRPRLQAIVHLTGGNPRLVLSLYQIFAEAEILETEQVFLTLLDELTPYFQHRMGELSPQQQKILDALAQMDGPSTPTELAASANLKVNAVTTQLRRLEHDGYLESQKEKGQRETLYDIRERMFRLWRQMSVEAGRHRLRAIVKFLEAWFTPQELLQHGAKLVSSMYQALEGQQSHLVKACAEELYYITESIAIPEAKAALHFQRIYGLERTGESSSSEEEVNELFNKATEQKDDHLLAVAWDAKAFLHYERGETEQALEALSSLIAQFKQAKEPGLLEQVAGALFNKGFALAEQGKLSKAFQEMQKGYQLAKEYQLENLIAEAVTLTFIFCLAVSLKSLEEGDVEKALTHFN